MEKVIEDAAKFRNAEEGRIALDVVRSIIATCRAAEVNLEWYLPEMLKLKPEFITEHADDLLPFTFSLTKN